MRIDYLHALETNIYVPAGQRVRYVRMPGFGARVSEVKAYRDAIDQLIAKNRAIAAQIDKIQKDAERRIDARTRPPRRSGGETARCHGEAPGLHRPAGIERRGAWHWMEAAPQSGGTAPELGAAP